MGGSINYIVFQEKWKVREISMPGFCIRAFIWEPTQPGNVHIHGIKLKIQYLDCIEAGKLGMQPVVALK
jgi:hypothetical protein